MADLGVINQTDPQRGVRAPDRRALVQAQGQALDGVGKVIKEAIVGGVEDDIVGGLEDRVEDLSAVNDPVGPPAELADNEQVALTARVDRLVKARDAGNSSQKTMAEMQIKQTVADATNKYPWLREELLRRAGQVSQTSVELDRLGLYDAARDASGKAAQAQLDDIQDHATGTWGSGGLNIDPSIPVGSQEWVFKYADRQALRNADTLRQQIVTARDVDSTLLFDNAVETLQGNISGARSALESIYHKNGLYVVLDQVMKGEEADPEILRQFSEVGKDTVILDLQQLNQNMITVYDNVWEPRLAGTEDGKVVKAMLDDFIAENNRRIELTRQIANGVPGAAEHFQFMMDVRVANHYRGQTEAYKNTQAFLTDPGFVTMLEVAGSAYSGAGQVLAQQVAGHAVSVLQGVNPTVLGSDASPAKRAAMAYMTSGQAAVGPDLTPGQVIDVLEKQMGDSPTPFTTPSGSDRQDQLGAATTIQLHKEMWNTAQAIDSQASPYKAATFATGINYGLLGLTKMSNRPIDLDEVTLANLADPNTYEMIEVMGDGEYSSQRRAFGMQMKNYYASTKPDQRRTQALTAYEKTRIGTTPLASLALINIDNMTNEGRVTYDIDESSLKSEVDARLEVANESYALDRVDQVPTRAPDRARIETEVTNQIAAVMDPIVNHVMQDLEIHRNIRVAERPSFNTTEGSLRHRYFQELGWLDGFRYTRPTIQ